MAQTQAEIQKRSDEKRGVKLCAFKFKHATIEKLEIIAKQRGLSKTALLEMLINEQTEQTEQDE